jgi:hypothetical protein
MGGRRIAPGPSTLDYVQDSAFLFFDGIENVGRGTHDGTASTWKNLVAGPDAVGTSLGTGEWNADGFYFKDTGGFPIDMTSVTWPSGGITVEVAYTLPQSGAWAGRVFGSTTGQNRRIMWQTNNTGNYGSTFTWGSDYPEYVTLAGTTYPRKLSVAIVGSTSASGKTVRWANANQTIASARTNIPSVKPGTITIGNETDLARPLYGVVHAVRFHSRQLTNAEIDANAALDRTRFGVT